MTHIDNVESVDNKEYDLLAYTRYLYLNSPDTTAEDIMTRLKHGFVLNPCSISHGNKYILLNGKKFTCVYSRLYIPFSFFGKISKAELEQALGTYKYVQKKGFRENLSFLAKACKDLFLP